MMAREVRQETRLVSSLLVAEVDAVVKVRLNRAEVGRMTTTAMAVAEVVVAEVVVAEAVEAAGIDGRRMAATTDTREVLSAVLRPIEKVVAIKATVVEVAAVGVVDETGDIRSSCRVEVVGLSNIIPVSMSLQMETHGLAEEASEK